jgi:hypothetical protein
MVARMPPRLSQELVAGDATALEAAILVAASVYARDPELMLARAEAAAATTRDRQLVAIAAAHLRGRPDVVDALARDHLVDHPDSVLAAWIADLSHRQTSDKEGS